MIGGSGRPSFGCTSLGLLGLSIVGAAPDSSGAVGVLDRASRIGESALRWLQNWYATTPTQDRIAWGGMLACAVLGLVITLDRLYRLRRGRVIPGSFQNRFRDRLSECALDRAKAADYCELNPSPASRVALAAIRRWGRTAGELERAFNMERQREGAKLMRGIATLRRIAGLSPLLGLLGTLAAAQRGLAGLGTESAVSWGPIVAVALGPLTVGLALAIIATVAYDACSARAEELLCELDRLGAEVVDAIVTNAPRESTRAEYRAEPGTPTRAPHVSHSTGRETHGRAGRRRDRGAGDVRGA